MEKLISVRRPLYFASHFWRPSKVKHAHAVDGRIAVFLINRPSPSIPTTMSSTQRPSSVVHQDYIARIRYSNTLPPPPNPPKLLDIPGTGLAGGQYTSAGYASKLAREQSLNIEADAELGMPIDLVGIPGIFDGDERGMMDCHTVVVRTPRY